MSTERLYEQGTMRVYASNSEGPYVKLADLVYMLLCKLTKESVEDLAVMITESFELSEALVKMLKGHGNESESWSGRTEERQKAGDKLREVLLPHADEAAMEFASNLIKENVRLRTQLEESKKHIAQLSAEWPESYKRYIPKEPFVFAQTPYLSQMDVRKLIDNYTAEQAAPAAR